MSINYIKLKMTDEFEIDLTKGTCHHQCWYKDGIVWIANDNDSYYTESFKSLEELEVFITKLRNCADECWN